MATILIVDDYSPIQRLMSFILRQEHYEVIIASNGQQALEKMFTTPVDLIITDWCMPNMDGYTLLKHIRTDGRLSHIPIIILTASGDDRDRRRACEAGASHFLTKPVESEEILHIVNQLLIQRHNDVKEESVVRQPSLAYMPAA